MLCIPGCPQATDGFNPGRQAQAAPTHGTQAGGRSTATDSALVPPRGALASCPQEPGAQLTASSGVRPGWPEVPDRTLVALSLSDYRAQETD